MHINILLHQWDLINKKINFNSIKEAGIDFITIPIMWKRVESEYEKWDFSYYEKIFSEIDKYDFKYIILPDSSGRTNSDDEGNPIPNTVVPDYVIFSQFDNNNNLIKFDEEINFQTDFYGNKVSALKYHDPFVINRTKKFYSKVIDHFSDLLGKDKIYGIALGIQQEFEIKYAQNGYKWRDYSDDLKLKFEEEHGFKPPIIDVSRSIKFMGQNNYCDGYSKLMEFREKNLINIISEISKIIKNRNLNVVGYFGEFFTSHDAIFQLSIIGELSKYIDCATVDYNFFDGYKNDPNPWKVPIMLSYCKHIGYKKIFGGFYVERWREEVGVQGSPLNNKIWPVIAESISYCKSLNLLDGIEIGGFGDLNHDIENIFEKFPILYASLNLKKIKSKKNKIKIGIFASHENFNWFSGEKGAEGDNINIHQIIVEKSFEMFFRDYRFYPIIISEKTLKYNPEIYEFLDLIYVCHQPALSDNTIEMITKFNKPLIQDLRMGEFTEDGHFRGNWCNKEFGIKSIEWENNEDFNQFSTIKSSIDKVYSNALLSPIKGSELIIKKNHDLDKGLIVKTNNRITLGFLPCLLEGNLKANKLKNLTLNIIEDIFLEDKFKRNKQKWNIF